MSLWHVKLGYVPKLFFAKCINLPEFNMSIWPSESQALNPIEHLEKWFPNHKHTVSCKSSVEEKYKTPKSVATEQQDLVCYDIKLVLIV